MRKRYLGVHHVTPSILTGNFVPLYKYFKLIRAYPFRSSFEDAKDSCRREGKKLLEITHQAENDLLSELLLHSRYSAGILSNIWTGGKARRRRGGRARIGSAYYYWTGSNSGIGSEL